MRSRLFANRGISERAEAFRASLRRSATAPQRRRVHRRPPADRAGSLPRLYRGPTRDRKTKLGRECYFSAFIGRKPENSNANSVPENYCRKFNTPRARTEVRCSRLYAVG